ncbi:DUF5926 family protein [Actinokineospora cianjurensis]|uniref:SEC-C motif-containing protein n=1 Tax=Actinokineospora cianjurensis TaxID=585224 RepID=A0A421B770_9PSEU|nr:DUF5926 family protein [Actinokineospora cianjurensis]RLK60125.1 SEC-C motif-containing protein [Actinokineospora cianjurensis]
MSRRSAVKSKAKAPDASGIGPRQPCPCGSGKRYKACHGSAGGAVEVAVARPFEGLAGERELIALREFVPSGTAVLPLVGQEREITLATVLPMAAAALVRADGVAYVGLQVQTRSSDISRDLARAVRWALTAEAGDVLTVVGPDTDAGDKPERLQDLVDLDAPLEASVHGDFSWWMPEGSEPSGEVALSLERANSAILPTERIGPAAYWVDAGDKAHLRWVRPEPEEELLAALARLHARGELALGEGSRYAGSFRAHGLLVPVWDLDRESHAREWTEAVDQLGTRLDAALASLADEPLTSDERRARDGLLGRQITIR